MYNYYSLMTEQKQIEMVHSSSYSPIWLRYVTNLMQCAMHIYYNFITLSYIFMKIKKLFFLLQRFKEQIIHIHIHCKKMCVPNTIWVTLQYFHKTFAILAIFAILDKYFWDILAVINSVDRHLCRKSIKDISLFNGLLYSGIEIPLHLHSTNLCIY